MRATPLALSFVLCLITQEGAKPNGHLIPFPGVLEGRPVVLAGPSSPVCRGLQGARPFWGSPFLCCAASADQGRSSDHVLLHGLLVQRKPASPTRQMMVKSWRLSS